MGLAFAGRQWHTLLNGRQRPSQRSSLRRCGPLTSWIKTASLSCLHLQLAPELLPPDALPPTPSPAPLSPAPRSPAPGAGGTTDGEAAPASSPTDGQPELQAAVAAGLEAAKDAVATVLGREARAMLLVSTSCMLWSSLLQHGMIWY